MRASLPWSDELKRKYISKYVRILISISIFDFPLSIPEMPQQVNRLLLAARKRREMTVARVRAQREERARSTELEEGETVELSSAVIQNYAERGRSAAPTSGDGARCVHRQE